MAVHYSYNTVMANIISILIGVIALFFTFIGLVSSRNSGMYFCLIVMAISALRLSLGGGII